MADTTGPTRTLPGSTHPVPLGQTCDKHPHLPATHRIQGETDSMGAELIDMCDECYHLFQLHDEPVRSGICEWCKNHSDGLRDYRDIDEGMAGRIYEVCPECIRIDQDRLAEEVDEDSDVGAFNSAPIDIGHLHENDDPNTEGYFDQLSDEE